MTHGNPDQPVLTGWPCLDVVFRDLFTLWWTNIAMERSTIFHGKIHYKWPFSIATLNYQRVTGMPFFAKKTQRPNFLLIREKWVPKLPIVGSHKKTIYKTTNGAIAGRLHSKHQPGWVRWAVAFRTVGLIQETTVRLCLKIGDIPSHFLLGKMRIWE